MVPDSLQSEPEIGISGYERIPRETYAFLARTVGFGATEDATAKSTSRLIHHWSSLSRYCVAR